MSLKGKLVGALLTAALVAPAVPAQAAETTDDLLGWAEAVWAGVTDLLPAPTPESSTAAQSEPSGDLNAALSIEPSG